MKLKTIMLVLAFTAAIIVAAPAGASWFGDISVLRSNTHTISRISHVDIATPSVALVKASNENLSKDTNGNSQQRVSSQENEPPRAKSGTPVSEPSNLLMLGLGIAGLIVGRYAAKRRRKKT